MFQTFYTDTLGSRFIKALLAQTPIPIFEAVVDGDHLLEGCYYVYKRFIIKCNSSGILKVSSSDILYPSDTLYPSEFLFVGSGFKAATFYVISRTDDYNIKTHSTFSSSTNYYDPETHYHLGRYLRYLYTSKGLNLFPFYNSFNSTYFSDIRLSVTNDIHKPVSISKITTDSNIKVIGVPICFGKTYTIYADCSSNVLVRACIHDNTGYSSEDSLSEKLQTVLSQSGKVYSKLSFRDPISFRVETSSKEAFMLQKNLYLVIQLPATNNSSIVVYENQSFASTIECDKNYVRKYSVINPSLIYMNTNITYAFSDRLLEYLIGQTIYSDEHISENVELVQSYVSKFSPEYKVALIQGIKKRGIWDNDISNHIFKIVDDYSKSNMIFDQDGNFNKDIQNILYTRGGNN